MNYSGIIRNDIANGDGLRVTLFVSGCSLQCPHCHNLEAQNKNYGKRFTKKTLNELCEELSKPHIDGLTLTGGHPLEDYNLYECTKLCHDIKWKYPNKSIWLYTGYQYENIKGYKILDFVDVLVDGCFVKELADRTLKWRGSSNQRVIDIKKTRESNQIILYCD